MARVTKNIEIENAHIFFKNFSGAPTKFNPNGGRRDFCVAIPDADMAQKMRDDGWNVRVLAPREEGDTPLNYLRVNVGFGDRVSPHILMIANGTQTVLDESDVGNLDTADIKSVDLIIRPYNWEVGANSGVSAYLKAMYVTIELDRFALKYAKMESPEDDLPFDI